MKNLYSKAFGAIQVVPQDPYWTKGPVFFNCLSKLIVKAGIVTGDIVWEPSLASWSLAIKREKELPFPIGLNWTLCLQPRHGVRCGTC